MALIIESPESRAGSKAFVGGPITRVFSVLHEPDLDAAYALVEATSGVVFEGRERKSIDHKSLGMPDGWLFTVFYAASAQQGERRPDNLSFRITSQPTHITQAEQDLFRYRAGDTYAGGSQLAVTIGLALDPGLDGVSTLESHIGQSVVVTGGAGWTVGNYLIEGLEGGAPGGAWIVSGAPAPALATGGIWHLSGTGTDNGGAIGVDRDSVKGADVVVPDGDFSIPQRRASFTLAEYRLLKSLVGKVTDRPFLDFPAGTLQYLGCEHQNSEGTIRNGDPVVWWCLWHQFRHAEHETNVRVGDITLPVVPAFSHVSAKYLPAAPAGAKSLAVKPSEIYVQRVCKYFNPEILGPF